MMHGGVSDCVMILTPTSKKVVVRIHQQDEPFGWVFEPTWLSFWMLKVSPTFQRASLLGDHVVVVVFDWLLYRVDLTVALKTGMDLPELCLILLNSL